PAPDAGGLVLARRRALLRALWRRPRGPRADLGEEPPQRYARAEVVPEARDHRRGRALRAHHLLALRPLPLRGADRRRRRRGPDPRRPGEGLPRRPRAREGGHRLRRPEPAEGPVERLPVLEADDPRGEGGLPPGGDQRPLPADRRRAAARLLLAHRAALLRGPRLLREGAGEGARRGGHLRARGRAPGEHRRRAQKLRPPHRPGPRAPDLPETAPP